MSPISHLLASWVLAAHTTRHPRDTRLVTLAGLAPDLDGLGLIIDLASEGPTQFYARYHHWLFHGAAGALLTAGFVALMARERGPAALWALVAFHLHVLCDLVGSRGPEPTDLWPIFYFGPFSPRPVWLWHGQWPLDAWPNRVFTLLLLGWSFVVAVARGHSFVGTFNRRADATFVATLRKWFCRGRPNGTGS